MRTVGLLLATAWSAGSLTAQEVLLRLRPPQGQVTRYLMTVETYVRGDVMAQINPDSTTPFIRMTSWHTSTVSAVRDDEYTEHVVIDSVRLEVPAAPHLAQMADQIGDLMAGTATQSRISTRGIVLESQFTPNPAARDMGQIGLGGLERLMLPTFCLAPEAPVRVGSTWRDSMTVSLDSMGVAAGAIRLVAAFTLRAMEGRVAVIGVDGTLQFPRGPMSAGGAFAAKGEVRLDLAAGRPAKLNMEMTGSAVTSMGEMPTTIRTSVTAR